MKYNGYALTSNKLTISTGGTRCREYEITEWRCRELGALAYASSVDGNDALNRVKEIIDGYIVAGYKELGITLAPSRLFSVRHDGVTIRGIVVFGRDNRVKSSEMIINKNHMIDFVINVGSGGFLTITTLGVIVKASELAARYFDGGGIDDTGSGVIKSFSTSDDEWSLLTKILVSFGNATL